MKQKSKLSERLEGYESAGPYRLIYGEGEFGVFAVCLAKSWEMRLSYPTARVFKSGLKEQAQWTEELLMDAMQGTLRRIRATYGGEWFLRIAHAEHEPYSGDRPVGSRAEAERLVLAGPDTPGKRFLENRTAPSMDALAASLAPPVEPPPVTTATRVALDALAGGAAVVEGGGAARFDPDNDPELQDEYSHRDESDPDQW